MSRTEGGTEIRLTADANGMPFRVLLTEDTGADYAEAVRIIADILTDARWLIMDKISWML